MHRRIRVGKIAFARLPTRMRIDMRFCPPYGSHYVFEPKEVANSEWRMANRGTPYSLLANRYSPIN
jgi:hypothetical protein